MAGGIVMGLVLALVMPVLLFAAGAIWSAIFGFFAVNDAEERYGEDSEVVKTKSW